MDPPYNHGQSVHNNISREMNCVCVQVHGLVNESLSSENVFPYLALPDTYLGNQLKSYGGNITFKIRYENIGAPLYSPYIIIAVRILQ